MKEKLTFQFLNKHSFQAKTNLCPFPSAGLPASNLHKLSELIVFFFLFLFFFLFIFFMLYVAQKRGLPRKCARFVLLCPIKKRYLCYLACFGSKQTVAVELCRHQSHAVLMCMLRTLQSGKGQIRFSIFRRLKFDPNPIKSVWI